MEPWQQSFAQSLSDPAIIAARFGLDPAVAAAVAARYPVRLTPHLLTLIEGADDPLGRQFLVVAVILEVLGYVVIRKIIQPKA